MEYKTKSFEHDENYEYKLILGAFLKYHRLESQMSLSFVSYALNINKGYLSEAENGKRFLAKNHLNALTNIMGTSFNDSRSTLIEARNILRELMKFYICLDYSSIKDVANKLKKEKSINKNSYAFFDCFLIELFNEVINNRDVNKIDEIKDILNEYIDVLNDEEQCIYFLLMSNHYVRLNDVSNTYSYLNKGYIKLEKYSNSLFLALLQHNEAVITSYCGFGNRAYICAQEALSYFRNTCYFQRIVSINNTIGLALISMELYDEAEKHFLNLYDNLDDQSYREEKVTILNNLSWCSILYGKYERAIYYTDLAIKAGSQFEELFINKPYALYKLERKKEALEIIKEAIKNENKTYFSDFLKLLYYRITNDKENFVNVAKILDEVTLEKKNFEIRKIVLEIIIDYYKEIEDQNNIIVYLDKLIICYKRKVKFQDKYNIG